MTQPNDKRGAEQKIFSLRKKIDLFLRAGDSARGVQAAGGNF